MQAEIDQCGVIAASQLSFDKRAPTLGFIRGALTMIDGSSLQFREFVDVQHSIERATYAYQYMDTAKNLIFRYDNADHYRNLNLPNQPHHKHEGSEQNVIASSAPTLASVLAEVELLVQLP